ncbi:hypothetical protein C8Q72DRAFT_327421 [Fomitopsis betulina]|nr:hypothetical protein C8Q72DRAFT_327421 [Fomitopsis betulina]
MRFTSVFFLAIATAAPALASYSEFDARDDAWASVARRSAYGQSSYNLREVRPDAATYYRRWFEELDKRGGSHSKAAQPAVKQYPKGQHPQYHMDPYRDYNKYQTSRSGKKE